MPRAPTETALRCPQCGAWMEQGAVPISSGLYWLRGRRGEVRDFAQSLPGTHAVMRSNRLEAWRCRKCQLVTMHYGRPLETKPEYVRALEDSSAEPSSSDSA